MNRIGRFVSAARSLLLVQLVAALIATALGVWAVVAVRDLAAERDRLRAQVADLEASRGTAAAPAPVGPPQSPLDTEVRPPAILPIAIPVPEAAPETNMILPGDAPPEAVPPGAGEPGAATPPTPQECTGTNATLARCRPGRWVRPDLIRQRPTPNTQPEVRRPTPNDRPQPD